MMEYADRAPGGRIGGLILVAVLHLGFGYVLLNGLGQQAVEVLRQPLETKLIETFVPPPEAPPPPPPTLAPPPPPYVPPPEVVIQPPPAPPPRAITAVTSQRPEVPAPLKSAPPPPAPPAPAAQPVRLPAVIDASKGCRAPEYPSMSRRLEETGTVILQFLIDVDGAVLSSKVDSSSGHSRLDQAALETLAKCRFKPGTVDGKPEQSWARIRYVWKLD